MTIEQSVTATAPSGTTAGPGAAGKRQWGLMLPGILIAVASLGLMVYVIYQTWFVEAMASGTGLLLLSALLPAYAGGVLVYSYGYHRRNWREALRLTAIVAGITVALLLILGVVLVIIAASSKRKGSSDSPDASKPDADKPDGKEAVAATAVASSVRAESDVSTGRELRRSLDPFVRRGPFDRDETQGSTPATTVKGVITCASCGRRFRPLKTTTACPQCQAPLPLR